jgi:DHA1 family bicyclomycin/chloramphenicol resistance-like MFS transporter
MQPVMSELRTATLGAMIVALGSISMALYTPALPALVEAFQTNPAAIKLTLTVYLMGFAFAILFCGPLSDAFGRRPVAIGFLVIYLMGSMVALVAPSVMWLTLGRIFQGIGAASGVTISRAIVRDQFSGQRSARIMNLIGLMLAAGPAVSPTIGSLILGGFGWHAIFAGMAGYGLLTLAAIATACTETNAAPDKDKARPLAIVRNYRILLTNRNFMVGSTLLGLTVGGVYTLTVILPFVLIEVVKLTPTQFGVAMIAQTGSYVLGTILTGRLLRRIDGSSLIPTGLSLVAVAGIGLALLPRFMPPTFFTTMLPVGLWAFGCALIIPVATTRALADFGHIAGAAAALTGFMQIGGGLLGSAIAALLFKDALSALMTVLPVMAGSAVVIYLALGRSGERVRMPDP